MNLITTLLGAAALLYGLYSLFVRMTHPAKFGKLEAMKQFWGERLGGAIHFVAYTLVPIAAGVALIIAGLRGVTIF